MKVCGKSLGFLARAAGALVLFVTAFVACRGNPQAESQVSKLAPADTESAAADSTRVASLDAKSAPLSYPAAVRGTHVDRYHGESVDDPYRWLEELDAPPTRAWIDAQNRLAQPYLERAPSHAWFKKRLTQLWNYERYGVPVKEGGRYFWLRNDGLQNQSVLYVADSLAATPRPLIDPNQLSKDATISMSDFEVSPDGRLVAYSLSDGGTDWDSWHVRDVVTGKDLPDVLRYTKFTGVSWERDSKGFYYSRYPELGAAGSGKGDDSKQVSIYRHRIGEPQSSDRQIYAVTDHPTRNPYGVLTEDGRFLIIDLFDSYAVNGVYYVEMAASGSATPRVVRLLDEWKAQYTFLGNRGAELFFLTTDDAPRGRVIAIDTANPARERWREVVPQAEDVLGTAHYIGGSFVLSYLHDAHAQVKVVDAAGRPRPDLSLPGLGKVEGFTGSQDDPETFFSYTDYLTPAAIYRYDVATQKLDVFRRPRVEADTSVYVTEQVFYRSKDGTRVPMFITRRKDFVKNGSAPVLLYGYGGFNSAQIPAFSASVLAWLEAGGVYAVANLRGGSEYGEDWHEAGTRLKKQNVFDDFIAAAEYLIAERYTSKQRIAALGRSNGGLLVGAVITQRPDLFAAALPAVGVLDMLRYHTASANARQWSSDYGLSENADEYRALRAYSPYHNVKPGACYPPTLVTTADHDDRVVPWHSFKFAAALQAAQGCANPVLIRIETRAGHGAGKPVWMQIEDIANQWAFLTQHLQMTPAGTMRAATSQ
ncbi:MAG TPA: prolyl oligopeptidase family serine peptidase [Steroidobacteraceae bacterium]|nr:prolyl oligopeptidase family serine peptidase [Steroidobacteraceae bacterium]